MNNIKALTIRQPYASLIAFGEKVYETRPFRTNYRGPLVIHSGKAFDDETIELIHREPFYSALARHNGTMDLPRGCAIAVADLVDVRPVEVEIDHLSEQERAFGDYSKGRYAWVLDNVHRLAEPISARGKQGIWTWDQPLPDSALTAIYRDIVLCLAEADLHGFFYKDVGGCCVLCDGINGHHDHWCVIGRATQLLGHEAVGP